MDKAEELDEITNFKLAKLIFGTFAISCSLFALIEFAGFRTSDSHSIDPESVFSTFMYAGIAVVNVILFLAVRQAETQSRSGVPFSEVQYIGGLLIVPVIALISWITNWRGIFSLGELNRSETILLIACVASTSSGIGLLCKQEFGWWSAVFTTLFVTASSLLLWNFDTGRMQDGQLTVSLVAAAFGIITSMLFNCESAPPRVMRHTKILIAISRAAVLIGSVQAIYSLATRHTV